MKKLLLALFAALCTSLAQSQVTNLDVDLDVNGLIIFNHYTDAQVRVALGEPTKYDTWDSETGVGREYVYTTVGGARTVFRCYGLGGFSDFVIRSPKFVILNGRLKVGDSLSKVTQLGFGKLLKASDSTYFFYLPHWDDAIEINVNSKGIITIMSLQPAV